MHAEAVCPVVLLTIREYLVVSLQLGMVYMTTPAEFWMRAVGTPGQLQAVDT